MLNIETWIYVDISSDVVTRPTMAMVIYKACVETECTVDHLSVLMVCSFQTVNIVIGILK